MAERKEEPELTGELLYEAQRVLSSSPASQSKKRSHDTAMAGGLLASRKALFKPFKAPGKATTSNTPSITKPAKRPRISSGFKSPTKSRPEAVSPSAEVARLESRAHILREALQIIEEDKLNEVERLDTKWVLAGRRAADELFAIVGEAGKPEKPPDPSAKGSVPWGFQRSEEEQDTLEAENRQRRYSAADVDAEDEDEEEELPSVQEFKQMAKMAVMQQGKRWPDLSSEGLDIEEQVQKWNTGEMLRSRGIDPSLFGWQNEAECWQGDE